MTDSSGSSTIDFSKMDQRGLEGALRRINRDKHPANFKACQAEISRRKEAGEWEDISHETLDIYINPPTTFPILRRGVAYFLDALILYVLFAAFFPLSFILGNFRFYPVLVQVLILVVSVAYTVTLIGPRGGGQTIGMKLMKTHYRDEAGQIPSSRAAWIRVAITFLPIFDWTFGTGLEIPAFLTPIFGFIYAASIANACCFFFQSEHRDLIDLASGLVFTDSRIQFPHLTNKKRKIFRAAGIASLSLTIPLTYLLRQGLERGKQAVEKGSVYEDIDRDIQFISSSRTVRSTTKEELILMFHAPAAFNSDREHAHEVAEKIRAKARQSLSEADAKLEVKIQFFGGRYFGLIAIPFTFVE